jgi:hypothetical protein
MIENVLLLALIIWLVLEFLLFFNKDSNKELQIRSFFDFIMINIAFIILSIVASAMSLCIIGFIKSNWLIAKTMFTITASILVVLLIKAGLYIVYKKTRN